MQGPILCPIDFSESSRGALRYAAALAEHFGSELTVITVNDPLLAEAAAMDSSAERVREDTRAELTRFSEDTIGRALKAGAVRYQVATGQPAPEILRACRERGAELIVMSSQGLSGFRKMFFGSTTERVLRETPAPVLVVPGSARGPDSVEDAAASVRRVLAPVLLGPGDGPPLATLRGLAEALPASALVLHVVEPVRAVVPKGDFYLTSVEQERRARAEAAVAALVAEHAPRAEALIAYGEPSEEIVKVAVARGAGLIVMGLQGSSLFGPRIGSVTYRVLSTAGCLVLALPPVEQREKIRSAGKNTGAPSRRQSHKQSIRSAKR
jgi:nucleotide-binding universal stress UspA family protein